VLEFIKKIKWGALIFITLVHIGALLAFWTFSWSALILCFVLYWLTGGIGITLGFHRLFSHHSFKVPKSIAYVIAFLGTLAGQSGLLWWVARHRAHHKEPDQEGDPHSPRDGFWWSHIGWLFVRSDLDEFETYKKFVPDLAKDPYYRFLTNYFWTVNFLLAGLLYLWGGVSFLVWGMAVRMVIVYHATWLVNSATHKWGYRSFRTQDDSCNLWWVSLVTFGEGWHNNHHAFQTSARHGFRWWEIDFTYIQIRVLALFRLARDIKVPILSLLSKKTAQKFSVVEENENILKIS
jgi:stearoyl-CoA desaturase (delta-9 desaturase)